MNQPNPYNLLGGEPAVRSLCREFYQAMETLPNAGEIRKMHKQSLIEVETLLFEYLSGWLGGPHIYQEKYGTICLTQAHKPYKIDESARDQWLLCMDTALTNIDASDEVKEMLKPAFFDLADFIRNDT